ncbi:MAG: hypothetical protein JXR76_12970 [Deltaproteobacteria bacterium]|nr:hypothetical protein [Deltaproteobacteria bacterium]
MPTKIDAKCTSNPIEETAFVFRHPRTFRVHIYPASEELLFAFKLVHDDISFQDAANEAAISEDEVEKIVDYAKLVGLVV